MYLWRLTMFAILSSGHAGLPAPRQHVHIQLRIQLFETLQPLGLGKLVSRAAEVERLREFLLTFAGQTALKAEAESRTDSWSGT